MPLRITARLERHEIERLLGELLPARIDLGALGEEPGRRWIQIDRPHEVAFVEGAGLRVRTKASLQWTALGFAIPATLNDVELLLRPEIATDAEGAKLVFVPSLGDLDIKRLPGFLDEVVAGRINAALAEEGDLLAWHFGRQLGIEVPMPSNLDPVSTFGLRPGEATVRVEPTALVFELELEARFERREGEPA